jgi:hypothetical protein
MDYKLRKTIFPLVSFVALVALACTCGNIGAADPTPTPVPVPTNPPPATKPPVELPTEPPATKPPIGGGDDGGNGTIIDDGGGSTITLSGPYTHPSGAFTITFPDGWEITEYANSTGALSPDGVASVTVYFENAGYTLDAEGITNYANNIEANYYGSYENYTQSSVEPQNDGSTGIFKTLDSDGVQYDVATYYWQDGTTLFIQDWWVASSEYDALSDGLVEVSNTMTWNGAAAAADVLYPLQYTYTCPNSLCSFAVPFGWSYTRNEDFDSTVIDSFSSPDSVTFIDNFVYDDGTTISKSAAGELAKLLLKEYYGVDDIVVTGDEVQSDGSERLDWYSPSGGYSGESFFETRGTTFLLLTWVVNDNYYDIYTNIWSDILSTYEIPE